ncbi:hypothetical protein CHS0354_016331 [Potamilus streckersoni]|uniref:Uncharacterized protein n=1 Tax=Potamilus streckersoni TaxID=2493646 RepID=A0AAE0SA54_9BIVA|nr:hypothetical protein CHS0354_016331 [Potamilus streckersoni]
MGTFFNNMMTELKKKQFVLCNTWEFSNEKGSRHKDVLRYMAYSVSEKDTVPDEDDPSIREAALLALGADDDDIERGCKDATLTSVLAVTYLVSYYFFYMSLY